MQCIIYIYIYIYIYLSKGTALQLFENEIEERILCNYVSSYLCLLFKFFFV